MLTLDQVKAQVLAAQSSGKPLSAVMTWAFSLDRAWGSVEVRRVWLACKGEPVKLKAPVTARGSHASIGAIMAAIDSPAMPRPVTAPKPKARPETFVEYLNRVGKDHQASSEANGVACASEPSPTAEDYYRAADTIEDLARALARMVDAFERDDMSCYGAEEKRATSAANRLLKARVMGKKIA